MVCVSKSLQGLQDFGNEEIIAILFAIFAVFKDVFRVRSASTGHRPVPLCARMADFDATLPGVWTGIRTQIVRRSRLLEPC